VLALTLSARGRAKPFVYVIIAVIVNAVALLICTGEDVSFVWLAVLTVIDAIVVVIGVTDVAELVKVVICLVWVRYVGAVVLIVRYAISIVICGNAICDTILVGIVEPLIDGPVAVVIFSVAKFLFRSGHRVALLDIPVRANIDGVLANSFTASDAPQSFVNVAVAIVVLAVAGLGNGRRSVTIGEAILGAFAGPWTALAGLLSVQWR